MTQPTNLTDRYDLTGVREELGDIIYNISPVDTPFLSNIEMMRSAQDFKEWQIESLAAASTSNKHIDGDDETPEAGTFTTRVGNYHQISKKIIAVSRRADKVVKAGRGSELEHQIMIKGEELKRDIEAISLNNQASLAGNSTTAPTTGGVPAWLTSNVSRGGGGSSGGFSAGIVGAATDGTIRALSEDGILTVHQSCYDNGGDPDVFMMGSIVKKLFSTFNFSSSARVATPYQDHGKQARMDAALIGTVGIYVSDFGIVECIINRFQRARDFLLLEMDMWGCSYLDSFLLEPLAKTGDSTKRHILSDYAVVCKNEASSGVFADVKTDTAMTT